MNKFTNNTKALTLENIPEWNRGRAGLYLYDKPSKYLEVWSRLLQIVVSQTLSYKFSGEFHDGECGIYKCEGGCYVKNVGNLVLGHEVCYFDTYGDNLKREERLASELITKLVVEWNPMEPANSLIKSASDWLNIPFDDLDALAADLNSKTNPFSGNALSNFFDRNPFDTTPLNQKYRKWCMLNFTDKTKKEVNTFFDDEKLSQKLLSKMIKKCNGAVENRYSSPLCCSPRRDEGGLRFWINTGRSTQIDGWKTKEQIQEFLKSDGVLFDTKK